MRDVKEMERWLGAFAHKALPYATRNTINQTAFRTMREARANVRTYMVTRNRWSEQSIRVNPSRTLNINRQAAAVGSIAPYMEVQEYGGVKRAGGREGTPIPTAYSAGQGLTARPRTRLPRKPNKLANIRLSSRGIRGNRRRRNIAVVKQAAESGQKYVYLDLGRRKGIFKVIGGKRRPKVRMVHDLTRRSVRIPREPWLRPAVDTLAPKMRGIHAESLRFQIRRFGIFK